MELTELTISNFRSFGKEPIVIPIDNFTAFIGHNSAGKSTILNALNCMFGKTRIKRNDFHENLNHPNTDEETKLYIEAKFEFYKENDSDDYSIPNFFESFTVDDPGKPPFLLVQFEASWEPGNTPEGLIQTNLSYVMFKEGEKEVRPMSIREKSKIDVIYIPAFRNPIEQLKNASGTILWRSLNQINWKEADKKVITEKIKSLDETIGSQKGIELLDKVISDQWKTYHKSSRFNNVNIKFGSTDLQQILRKLEVEFSPSPHNSPYGVNELGEGLQSLFYLSLIDSLLHLEQQGIDEFIKDKSDDERILNSNPPAITLLLVEEPENHVNPHLLGNVLKNLINISENMNSQVLFTSHSPSVIKRVKPENIRHVRLNNDSSMVKKIVLPEEEDEAHKFVKEAVKKFPELYFSSLVVFGEGDSEEILLPEFFAAFYPNLDYEGISIVPLGGRHVNHFWRLLNMLGIPFITLLDLDLERYGGGWGRVKYALEQLMKIDSKIGEVELLNKSTVNENIDTLIERDNDLNKLNEAKEMLEKYNVFFSAPLDIDFLMIEHFKESYLQTINENEGPVLTENRGRIKIKDISDEEKSKTPYLERRTKSISNTLKQNGGDGHSYSENQKELMIYYDYFFLNRGKPVTHILALQHMDLQENTPGVFKRMTQRIHEILKGDSE